MVDLPFPLLSAPLTLPTAPDAGVRPARPSDAADIAAVQLATWQQRYADVLPPAVLDPSTQQERAAHWSESITAPPSARHTILVATSGRLLVGYAVVAPTEGSAAPQHPPESGAAADTEPTGTITDLEVHPDATRLGHGSRLLAAAVEHLREHAAATVLTWCGTTDVARRTFFESAGLAPDGVRRRLDMGEGTEGIDEVRLGARLG